MKQVLFLAVVLAVSGCAAQKNWGASGGSKSDGTVKLSYTYGGFEKPVTDAEQAQTIAEQRCKSWGYSNAVAFDFVDTRCQRTGSTGCEQYIVTKEYQCE